MTAPASVGLPGARNAFVHTASLHAPHVPSHAKQQFVQTNVVGTQVLLDVAAECGVGRFVYSSSTSVYGNALEPGEAAVWVDETVVPRPRDIYDNG